MLIDFCISLVENTGVVASFSFFTYFLLNILYLFNVIMDTCFTKIYLNKQKKGTRLMFFQIFFNIFSINISKLSKRSQKNIKLVLSQSKCILKNILKYNIDALPNIVELLKFAGWVSFLSTQQFIKMLNFLANSFIEVLHACSSLLAFQIFMKFNLISRNLLMSSAD